MACDLKGRNFLTLKDFSSEEISFMLDLAADLKEKKMEAFNSFMKEPWVPIVLILIIIVIVTIVNAVINYRKKK